MNLRNGGDSFDWFFLALVELKLGHRDLALQWYEKAVHRFRQSVPSDRELFRFHVEAAEELHLPKPAPPTSGRAITPRPTPLIPLGSSPLLKRMRPKADGPPARPSSPEDWHGTSTSKPTPARKPVTD
jgi:hypothetical protein